MSDAPVLLPSADLEPARPYTRAGVCFDDLWEAPPGLRALLIERGLVYVTSWRQAGGDMYGGTIIAASRAQAERVAAARRLGERVDGVLGDVLPA